MLSLLRDLMSMLYLFDFFNMESVFVFCLYSNESAYSVTK